MGSNYKPVVIYHHPCADGFGSAYAAWKHFGDDAEYVPAQYGKPIPEFNTPPEEASVYMLDISWDRHTLLDLYERAGSLTVLDHHTTAEQELKGLPFALFDMDHSGAYLTWRYFHGASGEQVPQLLRYVEDRDLWRWEMEDSAAINAALSSYPKIFAIWDSLRDMLEDEEEFLVVRSQGWAIENAKMRYVHGICKNAVLMDIEGYEVPVLNTTAHHSEVGHRLLELYPDAPFSATYVMEHVPREDGRVEGTAWRWSLRGRGDVDVSEIARKNGGGGHPKAAGYMTFVRGRLTQRGLI